MLAGSWVDSAEAIEVKHPTKGGLVTVADKLSGDLAPGTLNSILHTVTVE
jgi:predicted RNA binding protein YcfA (HicA-like mRNA interferase family)